MFRIILGVLNCGPGLLIFVSLCSKSYTFSKYLILSLQSRMAELVSVEHRRVKFVEQASAILDRIPEAAAEVKFS